MKVLVVLAALVVTGVLWANHRRHATEHRLANVASELAGRRVGVQCQGFWASMLDIGQRSGEVDFPPDRPPDHMFLTRGVCSRLHAFTSVEARRRLDCLTGIDWTSWQTGSAFTGSCERRARADAEAINTLTHEAMHLRGITSEALAQCLAIQGDAWTVVRLGGTGEEGAAVAAFVLAMQPLLPSEYQSSECRAGGAFDRTPLTSAFPTEAPPAIPR